MSGPVLIGWGNDEATLGEALRLLAQQPYWQQVAIVLPIFALLVGVPLCVATEWFLRTGAVARWERQAQAAADARRKALCDAYWVAHHKAAYEADPCRYVRGVGEVGYCPGRPWCPY